MHGLRVFGNPSLTVPIYILYYSWTVRHLVSPSVLLAVHVPARASAAVLRSYVVHVHVHVHVVINSYIVVVETSKALGA